MLLGGKKRLVIWVCLEYAKIEASYVKASESITMSNHTPAAHNDATEHPEDVIEVVAHKMSYMLPIAGGILIFLLAFIAVNVA